MVQVEKGINYPGRRCRSERLPIWQAKLDLQKI
jgi:hypothetical protein